VVIETDNIIILMYLIGVILAYLSIIAREYLDSGSVTFEIMDIPISLLSWATVIFALGFIISDKVKSQKNRG
jgi:uncharacterized membrane protein